ncbi:MAG: hypothetical protein MZV65_30245 [Chromatiales bacterium]|nr:hypothetical protein [Chromatiales bacterium]
MGDLESALRTLVLNSSLTQASLVTQYLRDLRRLERMPSQAVESVFTHAPFLSRACPAELVDFALYVLRKQLPVVVKKSMRGRGYLVSHSFSRFEWDRLSIDDHFSFFPAAPTREPFHSLLQQAPDQKVGDWFGEIAQPRHSVMATAASAFPRERWNTYPARHASSRGARQVFSGAIAASTWVHVEASGHPPSIQAGWLLRRGRSGELEKGTPVDDVLQAVLEGIIGGALAVAAAIALQAQHISAITLPIATNQRLWHWDIRRQVQDMTQTANLIGFIKPQDRPHGLAVKEGNERSVRRADIRSLGTLMVLRGGELGAQAAAAIRGFSGDLPFDYAEQRNNAGVRADLARTAGIWAELGKPEKNYRAELSPDEFKVVISHESQGNRRGHSGDASPAQRDGTLSHSSELGLLLL